MYSLPPLNLLYMIRDISQDSLLHFVASNSFRRSHNQDSLIKHSDNTDLHFRVYNWICSVPACVLATFCHGILMMGKRPKLVDDHKMRLATTEDISDDFQLWELNHSNAAAGKSWARLIENGPLPVSVPRAEGVAAFRLLTGHDYLQAHLHGIGIAPTDQCQLCLKGRQNASHLLVCTALSRCRPPQAVDVRVWIYWEARRQMAEMSRTSVG